MDLRTLPGVVIGQIWGLFMDPPPPTQADLTHQIFNRALLARGVVPDHPLPPLTKELSLKRGRGGQHVLIPDKFRNTGVYIIGLPGTGKSTVALTMAVQDIIRGKGVAFIDPHDTARQLLDYIPKYRLNDVIYFEPKQFPIPIDLFEADDHDAMNELAADVIAMLKKLSSDQSWGPQMDTILKFAVHTLVRARQKLPITFLDLSKLLTSYKFLQECLATFDNETIHNFWREEYTAIRGKDVSGPVLRRLTDFRLSSVLPNIFGTVAPDRTLNIRSIMDNKKILIADLGNLLPDDQRVIGTFLITKIKLLLPRRKDRIPYYLYVDELDEFAASPYQEIITKCRKFNINLTLMNQGFYQIKEHNRKAIKRIPTKIVFAVDDEDTHLIATQLEPFTCEHVANLKTVPGRLHEALYRSPVSGTHLIRTYPLPPPARSPREAILNNMRKMRFVRECNALELCSTGSDANRTSTTASSAKPDEISEGPAPNVPSHGGKKKND